MFTQHGTTTLQCPYFHSSISRVCLLGAAYTLVLDMIAVELSAPEPKLKSSPNNADPPPGVGRLVLLQCISLFLVQPFVLCLCYSETASGLYALLLERICTCLRRWMNDFAVSSFALDILGGLANAHVPHPSLTRCKLLSEGLCTHSQTSYNALL